MSGTIQGVSAAGTGARVGAIVSSAWQARGMANANATPTNGTMVSFRLSMASPSRMLSKL
jgi:hypothetical protein